MIPYFSCPLLAVWKGEKHNFQSVKVLLHARKQEAFGGQGNNSVFLPEVRFEIIQHDKWGQYSPRYKNSWKSNEGPQKVISLASRGIEQRVFPKTGKKIFKYIFYKLTHIIGTQKEDP